MVPLYKKGHQYNIDHLTTCNSFDGLKCGEFNTISKIDSDVPNILSLSAFQKRTPLEVSMLQFFYAYMQQTPGQQLVDSWPSLLALLKEGLALNLTPPGIFLLLAWVTFYLLLIPLGLLLNIGGLEQYCGNPLLTYWSYCSLWQSHRYTHHLTAFTSLMRHIFVTNNCIFHITSREAQENFRPRGVNYCGVWWFVDYQKG